MAEYIDKRQALEALETLRGVLGDAGTDATKKLISGLDDPLIRCKECRYAEVDDPDFPRQNFCHAGCGWNDAEFFCSYGERKEA